MENSQRIYREQTRRSWMPLIFCLALIVVWGPASLAQSGRRTPKGSSPVPPPIGPPASSTPDKPATPKPETPRIPVLVTADQSGTMGYIPYYFNAAVIAACTARLKESSAVSASEGKEMTHGEAVKRAKAEKEMYLVWLQLRADTVDPMQRGDLRDIIIRYYVFAPQTGKIQMQGQAYQQMGRMGPGSVGLPPVATNNVAYAEYMLKKAAQEVADRVLNGLSVSAPSPPPSRP